MKRALVITYYWPPVTGAAAQRLFSFCKYLPAWGYAPVVLTPPLPSIPSPPAGFTGVHETVAGLDLVARLKQTRPGVPSVTAGSPPKILEWIRLNFFIPDTKIGWRRPAIRKAAELIEREKPDLVFTSAPPYTVHRIGLALKARFGLPWVADFRDPWMENHVYNTAPRMAWARALNRRMERDVLMAADRITCALDSQRELFLSKWGRREQDILTIHNGFDGDYWPAGRGLAPAPRFYLSHFGTVYEPGFDAAFFDRLAGLVRSNESLRTSFTLRMTGIVPASIREFLKSRFDKGHLEISGPVPHAEIQRQLAEQQILLLLVNQGESHRYSHPSKVFEYMASGNRVLVVGPAEHETLSLLRAGAPDRFIHASGDSAWESILPQWAEDRAQGRLPAVTHPPEQFGRNALTGRLAGVFNELLAPRN